MADKEYIDLFSPELANIFEDISQIHTDIGGGVEVFYLPQTLRDDLNKNIIDEVKARTYEKMFNIKIIPENKEMITTNSDLYNKYGFDLQNEAIFYVSQREYKARINDLDKETFNENEARTETIYKPMIGDIFWIPLRNVFLEIIDVGDEEQLFFGYRDWWKLICTEYSGRKSDAINVDAQTGDSEDRQDAIDTITNIENEIDTEYQNDIDPDETGFDPNDTKSINDDIEDASSDNKDSNSIDDIFGEF